MDQTGTINLPSNSWFQ